MRERAVVDHVVFATPDLADGSATIERLTGAVPTSGGRHGGLGTHNDLLALGPTTYLEIIAIDPTQPRPPTGRPFGLEETSPPRVAGFMIRYPPGMFDAAVARSRDAGHDPGPVSEMTRSRPDGSVVAWRLAVTDWTPQAGGLVPFLIDWGESAQPATSLPQHCRLTGLRGEHPDPASIRPTLDAVGFDLEIAEGPEPRLIASLDTPNGQIELH